MCTISALAVVQQRRDWMVLAAPETFKLFSLAKSASLLCMMFGSPQQHKHLL